MFIHKRINMRNFNQIYKHNKRMLNGSSISIISSENTLYDVYINSLLKEHIQRQNN